MYTDIFFIISYMLRNYCNFDTMYTDKMQSYIMAANVTGFYLLHNSNTMLPHMVSLYR